MMSRRPDTARRAAAGEEERCDRDDVEGDVYEGLRLQRRPSCLQETDADDAGREPGDERIEIECRRHRAERLRPARNQGQCDQHRGNREPVQVEQTQHAPGEFGVAHRFLDFRRPLHGGTLACDPRATRGAARVCDAVQASRYNAVMNLHEYQSKRVFADYGVPVPQGRVAATPAEAVAAARELPGPVWVVKAQVHAGGRGKGGGIKLCRSAEEAGKAAKAMLGQKLVTPQTGAAGLPVNLVYVEAGSAIERELYLSLLLDRERSRIAFVASAAGGMNIEEVAAHEPEKILRVDVDPAAGLQGYQCRQLAFGLGLAGKQVAEFERIVRALYKLYLERDLALVEVNPLDRDQGRRARRARRQDQRRRQRRCSASPSCVALRDPSQEDEMERQAAKHELNYVSLDGNIALHGERRRARDGDHGPDQAARRRTRELPRRRRRRQPRSASPRRSG